MAEVIVKSHLMIDLCDKAIEQEKSDFESLLPELQETQRHLDSIDLIATNFGIPVKRIYPLENATRRHDEKISKLESIRNLALLSEFITINDSDIRLLNINCEDHK